MKKNIKKAKRINKQEQLRVRTGLKSGLIEDCSWQCYEWCDSIGGKNPYYECSCDTS